MATRSMIYLQTGKDSYAGIYCHWDGYLSHNGAILQNYYNTREKVEELVALGNLSSLGRYLRAPEGTQHTFDDPWPNTCVAYGRDRGEENQEARTYTRKQIRESDGWEEYSYLFTLDNIWKYSTSNVVFKELQPVLERLNQ